MKTLYIVLAAVIVPFGAFVLAYRYLRAPQGKRRDFERVQDVRRTAAHMVNQNWTRITRAVKNQMHTERGPRPPTAQA